MTRGERTERLAIRLTPDEARVVSEVAAEMGLTVSDAVRLAIRKAYADRMKPKPKRK
jgi:antitoxin component of RelBE/YafQ-DinJ toxin-antitoxin module